MESTLNEKITAMYHIKQLSSSAAFALYIFIPFLTRSHQEGYVPMQNLGIAPAYKVKHKN
jgi:hypothetical protein